ncbi:MAG TPA: glucokinase [Thermoanaerobaculia bacterium]
MILGGDVGGTKTNLGLFAVEDGGLRLIRSAKYQSADFPGLSSVVQAFLAAGSPGGGEIRSACFGIPGPVIDNHASTPNLAWRVDGAQVAADIHVPVVSLINDLVATAEGIPLLEADEIAVLQTGTPDADGNRALIAAGTGLGMALLPRIDGGWRAAASEGGHSDFAPRNEDEVGLMFYLRERFGRVSVERVVSGPGLFNVYNYLRDERHMAENPQVREALAHGEDPARVISEAALAHDACALCDRALDLFVSAYGAVAGNLALTGTAMGGIYLGGGIAPKILPRLLRGPFLSSFTAKGRFVPYLEKVPVRVILNDRAALLGAARHAAAVLARRA